MLVAAPTPVLSPSSSALPRRRHPQPVATPSVAGIRQHLLSAPGFYTLRAATTSRSRGLISQGVPGHASDSTTTTTLRPRSTAMRAQIWCARVVVDRHRSSAQDMNHTSCNSRRVMPSANSGQLSRVSKWPGDDLRQVRYDLGRPFHAARASRPLLIFRTTSNRPVTSKSPRRSDC